MGNTFILGGIILPNQETLIQKFFSRQGRLNRKPYLLRMLVILLLLTLITLPIVTDTILSEGYFYFSLACFLVIAYASLNLQIRRLQDMGQKSPYAYVLFALSIVFRNFAAISLLLLIIDLYICFAPGTLGPNPYGEDPLADASAATLED